MSKKHPDALALDMIGRKIVMQHFGLSRQSYYYWRKTGIPKTCRNPVILLGKTNGTDVSEFITANA